MNTNKAKKRNEAIDFLRGCACVCIILIHTAWWSGNDYLPGWFKNAFLFFDVPMFMFLAGLSYHYIESVGKNIKGILKQWNKWVFFLLFYYAIIIIFFRSEFNPRNIVNSIFYLMPVEGSLKVIPGSLWFIFMYIQVTILCSIILYFYNTKKSPIEFKHILIFMFFLTVINLPFVDSNIAIYSFLYLLGYYSYKNKINSTKILILLEMAMIVLAVIVFKISGYGITDIQMLKGPVTVYYLLISIPSILLIWFLKDRIKKSPSKLISYIGKNAIFFYYAQGISSSLIFFIYPHLNISNIYLRFCHMALFNIVMGITIGIIINELYNLSYKLITKIKLKLLNNKKKKKIRKN